ncbi:amidohydrolase family protein [Streptomyces sp. NPDC059477]|uniref:amidohydrolase family protein n=1 Tax=Streptomyces sp. NPDC059477 TaxID=3346847 RepID=UPI00367FBCC1
MTGVSVTDVHAHALVPSVELLVEGNSRKRREQEEQARLMGPESLRVTLRMSRDAHRSLTDLDVRIKAMDAAGVDVQLVSPSPSQYYYWAEPSLAREIFTATNEAVAAMCAQAGGRLTGLGVVPLQHPGLAVEALEHAVLTCGLKGIEISSFAPYGDGVQRREGVGPAGRLDAVGAPGAVDAVGPVERVDLSHPALDPLWARAEELGALVFLHPLGCTVDGRLDHWYLYNVIGQPLEHTIALSHLIFSGALDRHPRLRILAAHGGGYLPVHLGRAEHAWRERPEARTCARPPGEYVREIFFDSLVYTPHALRHLVDTVGADQVLLGSDYPYDMGVTDPLDRLTAAGLSPGQRDRVAGGNAARLGLIP